MVKSEQQVEELRRGILDFFRYSITSDDNRSLLSIGRLTEDGRHLLEKLRGNPFKNQEVDFVLNPSDLRHIYKDHYGLNEKDPGNNIPLSDKDIMMIGDMLVSTSDIVYGTDKRTGSKLFFFLCKSDDGAYNLAEIYSNSNGNLSLKSLYNTKKGPSQRVMMLMSTLLPTSVTYSGSTLSSGAKLPNLFELHKDFEEKIPLDRNFRIQKVATDHGVPYEDLQKYIYSSIHDSQLHTSRLFEGMILDYHQSHPNLDLGIVRQMMSFFKKDVDEVIDKHLASRYKSSAGIHIHTDIPLPDIKSAEHAAKQAVHDRITNSWQRAFSQNQRFDLGYYAGLSSDIIPSELFRHLYEDVIKDPEVARKPEKWKADTLRELNDLAEGIVREQGQGLKR